MEKGKTTCIGCYYYFITWDTAHPKGCKLYGFKGHKMPCYTVIEATGNTCPNYIDKKQVKTVE